MKNKKVYNSTSKLIKEYPKEIDFIIETLFDSLSENLYGGGANVEFRTKKKKSVFGKILREKPVCISVEGDKLYLGDTIYYVSHLSEKVDKYIYENYKEYFIDYSKGADKRQHYKGDLVFSKKENALNLVKSNIVVNQKNKEEQNIKKEKKQKQERYKKYLKLKKEFNK